MNELMGENHFCELAMLLSFKIYNFLFQHFVSSSFSIMLHDAPFIFLMVAPAVMSSFIVFFFCTMSKFILTEHWVSVNIGELLSM